METSKYFLLFSLGLFTVICHANPQPVQVFGKHTSDDPLKQLDNLQAEKAYLEREISRTEPGEQLNHLNMRLRNAKYWIKEITESSKVLYTDYLRMMAQLEASGKGPSEKEKMLAEEKDRISKKFEEYAETQDQQLKRLAEEKDQLIKEREEIARKLKEAQDLYSVTLETMVKTTQKDYKLASLPYQNEIESLRTSLAALIRKSTDNHQINELLTTQTKLQGLLKKLYDESQFFSETDFTDFEKKLAEMEIESLRLKAKHDNRKKDIVKNMKDKGSVYNAEDIASLQQVNKEMEETQKNLQEIAQKSAYLKAISQVANLETDCKNAIKDVEERNASKKENGLQEEITHSKQEHAGEVEDFITSTSTVKGSIHDIIYHKGLMYKDQLEFYRTRLSTVIVDGLAKVNKILPIPLPGCSINPLIEIRDKLSKWAERIEYALRLTRTLHPYDNKSMVARFFSQFLANIQTALYALVGKSVPPKIDLVDDEEITRSVEEFQKEGTGDFYKNYQFVKENLMHLLDVDSQLDDEQLKEFRYHFIIVKRVPDILVERSESMLEEITDGPSENNQWKRLEKFVPILDEMESSTVRLHELFGTVIRRVKTTAETYHQQYQAAVEEYKQCRHGLVTGLPVFRNVK